MPTTLIRRTARLRDLGLGRTRLIRRAAVDSAVDVMPNGDFETDLAGWQNVGTVTRSRSNEQAHSGAWSQKIVTSSQAFAGGFANGMAWTTGQTVTARCWLYGAAGDTVRISLFDGSVFGGTPDAGVPLGVTGWNFFAYAGTAPGDTANGQLYIDTGASAQSVTWYLDDVQMMVA